jgi:hypothetical protein
MENVGIFYIQPLGIYYDRWVIFVVSWYILSPFWYIVTGKSGKPDGMKDPEIFGNKKPFTYVTG